MKSTTDRPPQDTRLALEAPGIIERARQGSRNDAVRLIRHVIAEADAGRRMDVRVEQFLATAFAEFVSGVPHGLESCLGLRPRNGRPRGRREHSSDELVEILERMDSADVVAEAAAAPKLKGGTVGAAKRAEIAARQVSGNKPNFKTVERARTAKRKADLEAEDVRSGRWLPSKTGGG